MCINCERYKKKEQEEDAVVGFLSQEPTGIYPPFGISPIREIRCEPDCPLCNSSNDFPVTIQES